MSVNDNRPNQTSIPSNSKQRKPIIGALEKEFYSSIIPPSPIQSQIHSPFPNNSSPFSSPSSSLVQSNEKTGSSVYYLPEKLKKDPRIKALQKKEDRRGRAPSADFSKINLSDQKMLLEIMKRNELEPLFRLIFSNTVPHGPFSKQISSIAKKNTTSDTKTGRPKGRPRKEFSPEETDRIIQEHLAKRKHGRNQSEKTKKDPNSTSPKRQRGNDSMSNFKEKIELHEMGCVLREELLAKTNQ